MSLAEQRAKLQTLTAQIRTLLAQYENREPTANERAEVTRLMEEARGVRAYLDAHDSDDAMRAAIDSLTGEPTRSTAIAARPGSWQSHGSLGAQFVGSAAYRSIQASAGRRPRVWSSDPIELLAPLPALFAATLTSEPSSPPSGGPLIVPDYQPGIVPSVTHPITTIDLFPQAPTTSNVVGFMIETEFDNAAAPTAEGAEKPESTLAFDSETEEVRKIAHWLPVTEEMLADGPALRAYIDSRLRLGVSLAEDDQLLNGDGNAPNLNGLLARAGLTAAHPRGADSNADAILKQMVIIQTAVSQPCSAAILHPTNWESLLLSKTTAGDYLYSGPAALPSPPRLWGLPVAVTTAITAGVAVVGAFATAATIFRRGGIQVDASNSHADFFVRNLVAIRAEERLALVIRREAAFGLVTGLN